MASTVSRNTEPRARLLGPPRFREIRPSGPSARKACNVDQHPQARQLVAAHRDHRHPTPPRQASSKPSSVTSLSVRPVTFLSVIYSFESDKVDSGKSLWPAQ